MKRKDVSGVTAQADDESVVPPAAKGGKADQGKGAKAKPAQDAEADDDDDKITFRSKTQVLNLFSVDCDRVAE